MHRLEELKNMLCDELEEYAAKDSLDMGSLEVVDKLAHAIKNIDKIIEASNYSGRRYYGNDAQYDSPYYRARGRRNARRDSMGRYSRGNDMMIDELRELMDDAPDERTRAEFERLIAKMER